METQRSEPICIPSEPCSPIEEWQDLEQFWGEAKQRLQDPESLPLSSSLEEHLLHDDYIPTVKEESLAKNSCNKWAVRGEDIGDIPTCYDSKGFKPGELVVKGTYVDPKIIPGFRYKVRKNLNDEYLFGGKSLRLESIGLGYGKRMTFESYTLNENDNFFWSDSYGPGYGLQLQAVDPDENFHIMDTSLGKKIGRAIVCKSESNEISSAVSEDGQIQKECRVYIICDVILNDSSNMQNIYIEDVATQGVAQILRNANSSKAELQKIILDNFILEGCQLLPE
ncbi:uncharacterized protein LOC118181216 [Stegodyphus dumicola]|uniref:uncharacterized protein LOC118181216 n=1 Tax=Stegodyphus dumicola TaxID=202533 RepID=UPI0015AD2875|nr:uncharacterized protein LOC118181216 [Stegodyphus dumicola]